MSVLWVAIGVELGKAWRSRVPWVIGIGFSVAPLVGGLFMVILKDPETARKLGLLGTKAQLVGGSADWPTYLGLVSQAMAVGGGILFAFLAAWVFGREFADRTVRGLLAIPTPRWAIVVAKTVVVMTWGIAISAWVTALGFAIGAAVSIPGWNPALGWSTLGTLTIIAVMVVGLQTTTAFFASAGRGYIPPLAWAVLTIVAAQVLGVLGRGAVFPWAVPAIVSGAAGPDGEVASVASYVIVAVTVVIGLGATIIWWERADQTG
jgi:ABC-2 type transport system permease protein